MQSLVNGIDSSKRFKLTCCADHAGPLARTVLETAQLLDATSGYDGIDDRGLGSP
jgi:Asp-tRNA(Asn)/Glu-tRNA(Gln) amidotransferase A subunit family amidase